MIEYKRILTPLQQKNEQAHYGLVRFFQEASIFSTSVSNSIGLNGLDMK